MSEPSVVRVNHEQGLYVIPCSKGFTTLGFDWAFNLAVKVSQWIHKLGETCPIPTSELKGTITGYQQYRDIMDFGSEFNGRTGQRCPTELTPQLIGLEGRRVEVEDKDGDTRRFWVGKSTGWCPCHLEIARRNSTGGPAVMGAPFRHVTVIR